MLRIWFISAILLFFTGIAQAAERTPLFQADDALDITLSGPFDEIDSARDREASYEGTLSYLAADGQTITLDATFEVRGNYRLQRDVCRYSQLWVDLRRSQVSGTLFEGQNRMKLVVQCRPQPEYSDLVYKEYQAYRMFDRLAEPGFGSRLVNVTYQYSDDPGESRTHAGLFVEDRENVAERFGLETVEDNGVELARLAPRQATIVALFMLMLGNTDYSLILGPEGDECCHNAKLLNDGTSLIPIPYDFDASGFVNASYAADPAPNLGLRNNRQRLFRGYCLHNDQLETVIPLFLEARDDILALSSEPPLASERSQQSAVDYLQDFFAIISDPELVEDDIVDDCRG